MSMNVVFMGTPEFAVSCLKRLISDGHNVKAVYTRADKPCGRGNKMTAPPVKIEAMKHNIQVFQPSTLKDDEVYKELKELNPEVIIVVAYGRILPNRILDLPKYGCINIHASLLPKYRGAAPIQWAVINGETVSGVTSMQMDEGIDTGDMLLKAEIPISPDETAGSLHDRLSILGADILSDTLKAVKNENLKPEKQNDELSNYAPMLTKELCPVDWSKEASEIHNKIRGLSPWPVAITTIDGKTIKLHSSEICNINIADSYEPGTVVENENCLTVYCGNDTAINITCVQAEGKKAMRITDYLRGNPIPVGTVLG